MSIDFKAVHLINRYFNNTSYTYSYVYIFQVILIRTVLYGNTVNEIHIFYFKYFLHIYIKNGLPLLGGTLITIKNSILICILVLSQQ